MKPINIGFGNMVIQSRIVAIINPDSAPSKGLEMKQKQKID